MKVIEMMGILQKLPQQEELWVESSPSQEWDRTTQIKVLKIGREGYIIIDEDSTTYKGREIK